MLEVTSVGFRVRCDNGDHCKRGKDKWVGVVFEGLDLNTTKEERPRLAFQQLEPQGWRFSHTFGTNLSAFCSTECKDDF